MKTAKFDPVVGMVPQWREALVDRLQDPATRHESSILKRHIDDDIGCLELASGTGFGLM